MSVPRNRGIKPRVPVEVDGTQVLLDFFGSIHRRDLAIDLDYKGICKSESHDGGGDWIDTIVGVRWML